MKITSTDACLGMVVLVEAVDSMTIERMETMMTPPRLEKAHEMQDAVCMR